MLSPKNGLIPESKRELRFETNEKAPADFKTISRIDELVVMDSVAFVL